MQPDSYSEDRLQNSVLKFTEIKVYSFYCIAQQRLKEICVVKQQPQERLQKSHKQDVLQKHLQTDRSIFASYGTPVINYFVSFCWASLCVWDAGRRGNKITEQFDKGHKQYT